jgi:hypothetical protein
MVSKPNLLFFNCGSYPPRLRARFAEKVSRTRVYAKWGEKRKFGLLTIFTTQNRRRSPVEAAEVAG